MAQVPQWNASGDWFDVCSCSIPCPCEFAQPPTNNYCQGVLAWHIRNGKYGDVDLAGLNVLAVGDFEGNPWAGAKVRMGIYLDERADKRQREALQTIFMGKAGGWPAAFGELIGEVRGSDFAPITFELDDDLARWRVEIPGRAVAAAEAMTGPTTPPGKRVQLLNPPGSEVGPGEGPATWGVGTELKVDAFGYQMQFSGSSSKHIPFDWRGPDQAQA